MPEQVRIQKALADAGVASRRAAEVLVSAGRVAVNGTPAVIGQRVDVTTDVVTVDGRPLAAAPEPVYLVLNKPAGVTSTVSDRHASRTVIDLVPPDVRRRGARIYPVGRLDRESEGLLLLTNDGQWAQRMLHPSHGVEREYAVGVARPLAPAQLRGLEGGVELDEGRAWAVALHLATLPEVRRLARLLGPAAERLTWYHLTLRQGWRRQVRRMFAASGAPVERLVRVRFGTIRLGEMALGEVRPLSSRERRHLEALVDSEADDAPLRRGRPVVSIDGPGGSGKSSVGARAATRLGFRFADTGVLYRGLTWLALEEGIDPDEGPALARLAEHIELTAGRDQRYETLLARGRDVTHLLHTPDVDRNVSRVSRHPVVRASLMPVQRRLVGEGGGMIMAGRDIGTVVLPDADVKLFLNVSVEERARRRALERGVSADPAALRQTEDELRRRDGVDSTRAAAPLRIPDDAIVIDTEGNTLEQTVAAVVAVIEQRPRHDDGDGRGETA